MKLINLEQGSPEWLEFRRMGIGASDAPSIMGVGFKTAEQLLDDKLSGKEQIVNVAMQRGKDLEEPARQAFMQATGLSVAPAVVVSDDLSWQFASLDGMDMMQEFFVEIKCPGYKDHATAMVGMIPAKYYPQLQHQFSVTGMKKGYYYSFDGKNGALVEIERDDKYIEELLERERKFFERMMNFDSPKITDKDFVMLDDAEWDEVCIEYRKVKDELQDLQDKEKKLKERLISIASERNIRSCGVKLMKVLRKGNICYDKIPQLVGVDLDQYRSKPIEYWNLTIDN